MNNKACTINSEIRYSLNYSIPCSSVPDLGVEEGMSKLSPAAIDTTDNNDSASLVPNMMILAVIGCFLLSNNK